jgi:hypothetical protein
VNVEVSLTEEMLNKETEMSASLFESVHCEVGLPGICSATCSFEGTVLRIRENHRRSESM